MNVPAISMGESPTRRALKRFFRHKLAVFGLVVVIAFVLMALLAPLIGGFASQVGHEMML